LSYTCTNIDNLNAQQWDEYCEHLKSSNLPAQEGFNSGAELKAVRESYKAKYKMFLEFIICKDSSINSWIRFATSDNERPKDIFITAGKISGFLSNEKFRALAEMFNELADKYNERGITEGITFLTENDAVKAFAEKAGLPVVKKINYYELKRENINLKALQGWANTKPAPGGGFSLELYHDLPEELLGKYCSLFTELLNQMPCENEKQEPYIVKPAVHRNRMDELIAGGYKFYIYLVFNEERELIGMTNVLVNDEKRYYNQFMTGVKNSYRGRGIGKWMKAAMYIKLLEDFPLMRKIDTDANAVNSYIQDINGEIGFKLTHTGWVCELNPIKPQRRKEENFATETQS
jgi:hypothetical protein